MDLSFPRYLKLKNNKVYYKINSNEAWEEIQVIGSKLILNSFSVKIFPDRNHLNDLINNADNRWEIISEEEYESIKAKTKI